jgi:RNA recognition motif-containing protein
MRAGAIRHISIPKYKETSEARAFENKGFAFVEYSTPELAEKAISTFNNCVPEELTNTENPNYIPVTGRLTSFRVISKSEWTKFKQEAKQIKRDIAALGMEDHKED